MLEQEYEISSPPPSLFSSSPPSLFSSSPPSLFLSENDETSFDEFDNYNDSIYSEDSEVENEKNNYEIFEEQDKTIDYLENVEFTPCVVIDFVKGKIQRCGETKKLR